MNTSDYHNNPVISDFRNFLYLVWSHLNLPQPTQVQYDIADYLQHGPKRKIIEGFRGVGKSWITTAFVLWLLLRDPVNEKVLVVSANQDRANAFTTFTKRLINDMTVLNPLKPDRNIGQRDSNIAFDVRPAGIAHAPSVKSVGIFGQLTGSRATHIVADDVEVPKNSLTQVQREKLAEAVKEFDAVLSPGGIITYLGTPQTEMSLYNILPERGYSTRIWPVRYPTRDKIDLYEGKLAPWIIDNMDRNLVNPLDPVDPERFNQLEIIDREASYGRSGFALQFMLDTSLSDADRFPLKLSDLIVMDLNPELAPSQVVWASAPHLVLSDVPNVGLQGDRVYGPMHVSNEWLPLSGVVMSIDPAGRGADETGYAVVGMLHGKLFALEISSVSGYDDDSLTKLASVALRWGVNLVLVESNFGDGMFTEILKPHLRNVGRPITVEEVRHNQRKESRIIDTMEPIMNQHRLVLNKSILMDDSRIEQRDYQLAYQMTRLTNERGALSHDDKLDALSIAVSHWVKVMAQDSTEEYNQWKEQQLEEMLESHLNHLLEIEEPSVKTWANPKDTPGRWPQ